MGRAAGNAEKTAAASIDYVRADAARLLNVIKYRHCSHDR